MPQAPRDATAVDRIRDAALALFGANGFDGASVRDIARRAGVSPGLVIHHFGSKDELRAACDTWIIDTVMGRKQRTLESAIAGDDLSATLQNWLQDPEAHRVELDYLARMVADGSPAGATLFDHLVDRTAQMLASAADAGQVRRSSDPTVTAVIVAAYGLMPLLLERHLARSLDAERMDAAAIRRLTLPMLELYTHGLYTGTELLDATAAALTEHPPTQEEP